MEEKYRKIAIDLGLKKENNECCEGGCMCSEQTPLEKEQAEKIKKLEFQVKTLTTLLVENKSHFDDYEENYRKSQSDYYELYKKKLLLEKEIEELKTIIDKLMEPKEIPDEHASTKDKARK